MKVLDENGLTYYNNKIKRTVLWTNNNPTEAMTTGRAITLNSADYDELEWIFAYSTTANNGLSINCLKGQNVHATTMGYSNPILVRRTINYVADTLYQASGGKYGDSDSDIMLIPVQVIGIKNQNV